VREDLLDIDQFSCGTAFLNVLEGFSLLERAKLCGNHLRIAKALARGQFGNPEKGSACRWKPLQEDR
jgi:hypothetical protein